MHISGVTLRWYLVIAKSNGHRVTREVLACTARDAISVVKVELGHLYSYDALVGAT